MSIKYPILSAVADLAHFRHYRHFRHISSLITNVPSTFVENPLQIDPFYAKQSQSQVRSNQHKHLFNNEIRKYRHLVIQTNKANSNPIKAKTNPIQTQFVERVKNDAKFVFTKDYEEKRGYGPKKTNPNKPNFCTISRGKPRGRYS